MLYEYSSFPSLHCLPKYDEYIDDDEHNDQISFAEESELILAESTIQVQKSEPNDQFGHFNYEEEEENAANIEFKEGTLPFCFNSFQLIKDNYHAIYNQALSSVDTDSLEESQIIVQNIFPLVSQPQRAIEYQIEEDLEETTYDQVIQVDPLPLFFQPYELFEEEEEE